MAESINFIEQIINEELEAGKFEERGNKIVTRFPPEPNGYLHIGHCKSLCINFGVKEKYGGECNLRFDDTNPAKETEEFAQSIIDSLDWLGFSYDRILYASDYYDRMYEIAEKMISDGNAYVCDLSAEEITETRGTLTEPGKESPYRNRTVEENLKLFREMKAGKYADGEKVLRAKIDMASPNINMRDPILYRVAHVSHYRTGDKWCIYPMYDFAHPIEDAIEGITHSICTLEFEDHRPLYNWVVEHSGFAAPLPRQIEFARLNLTNTVMSKRYLKKLVEEGKVHGWDDPRMPTLAGLKNRGVPPTALKNFCNLIGVSKANSECQYSYLEACIREYLNENAERAMAVIDPLKLTITNYEGEEELEFDVNQFKPELGKRKVTFGKTLYIERSDFSLNPPPKYFRLKVGGVVRLKSAYIVRCDGYRTDEEGNVTEVLCTYLPDSRSGSDVSGVKAKGVIHWVNAERAVDAVIKQYEPLLKDAAYPGQDFSERMNEDSEHIFYGKAEPYLAEKEEQSFQLMRTGYYKTCREEGKLCLSEIVSLKDNFNK
ncbi:MAG: glutamine--tRNA ligase/YqeY domain fusion protein [Clostridia bacterium]|nr:glutamine--tRNA ligase/YqeY domain fusion protein [Clostridia bacterium]